MTQVSHGGLYQAPPEQPAPQVVEPVAPQATYTQGAVPTPVEQQQVVETVVEPVAEPQPEVVEQQAPEPVAPEQPAPEVVETPVEEVTETVVAETEAPVVAETEAAVVEETQAPVVEETQAPVVEETQAPVAAAKEESTYDDIVEEQPATATEAATEQVDTVEETNEAVEYADEEGDEGNCDDPELRAIVENALKNEKDNLEAARKIEGDASAKFGGRFNAIVSDAEFAYVNWYGKRNCQLRYENRHSLTWED